MTPESSPPSRTERDDRGRQLAPFPEFVPDAADHGRTAMMEPPSRPRAIADPRAVFASGTAAELHAFAVSRLGRSGRFRADVLLLERDGARAVLKDFGATGVRAAIGRILVAREARAYAALADEPCAPRLYRLAGRTAILLEWRDASPLRGEEAKAASEDYFAELRAAVDRLHSRGLAHLDLRKHRNVLIDRGGLPVIVDFAAAVRPRRLSPLRLLMPLFRAIDRGAVLKHRRRTMPTSLSHFERFAERVFHALGRAWKLVRLH